MHSPTRTQTNLMRSKNYIIVGLALIAIVTISLGLGLTLRKESDVLEPASKMVETKTDHTGNVDPCFPNSHLQESQVLNVIRTASTALKLQSDAPVQLFQGYNSVSGSGLGTVLEGCSVTLGGQSRVDYYVCTDVSSVSNSLDIGVNAFFAFGPVFGIDAKVKFVRDLRLTKYSVSIIVHSRHGLSTTTATDQRLKDGVVPPQSDDQLRDFVRRRGDSFISTITLGSEYYAVYTFHASSSFEQTGFVAELAAKSIVGHGHLDRGFGIKLSSVLSSTSILYSFNQSVAGIANPKLPSESELINYALRFVAIPIDSPVIISYDFVGYEAVLNYSTFQPIVRNRDYFLGDRNSKGGVLKDLVDINSQGYKLEELVNIYHFYNYSDDSKVHVARAEVQKDLQQIFEQVSAFSEDPLVNLTSPSLDSLKRGTPHLSYSVGQSPSYGSNLYGNPFDDVDINSYLQRQTRITSLAIGTNYWWKADSARYAYCVSDLTVTYVDKSGVPRTVTHGGGGYAGNTLQLLPDQSVICIDGKASEQVDWLQVTNSDGRAITGGNTYYGHSFKWSLPPGSTLMGFKGRCSGTWLYQIAVTYATLQPAKWSHPV